MIEATKQYTYGGFEFRVYATDGGGDLNIHGAFKDDVGRWISVAVRDVSLIEVKPEHTLWFNIYRDSATCIAYAYATKELADKGASASDRVACVKITFREGDGL